MRTRNKLLAVLALLFAGPAMAAEPCADKHWLAEPVAALAGPAAGGSEDGGEDSGMGGTGVRSGARLPVAAAGSGDEEGFGGTGIIGVIAGFASICVNGEEIHFQARTPTLIDGRPATTAVLALGQTVAVRATRSEGSYTAQEIHVLHEVRGPVQSIDVTAGTFSVLGQRVRVPPHLASALRIGDGVAVSGNRLQDGVILAQRIESASATDTALIGAVAEADGSRIRIGGQWVRLPAGVAAPAAGVEVRVSGRLHAGELVAERLSIDPRLDFAVPVERLHLQGYVRQARSGGSIDVDGMRLAAALENPPEPGQRVEILARVARDGQIIAERWSAGRPAIALPPPTTSPTSRPGAERGDLPAHPARATPRIGTPRPERSFPADLQRPMLPRPELHRPLIPRIERLQRPDLPRPLR